MRNESAPPGKELKYALIERERRFLLSGPPRLSSIRSVAITDHYLRGTRIRLRQIIEETDDGEVVVYKLTQKVPGPGGGPGLITTMYLDRGEYLAFADLPAEVLRKNRYSIPPYGLDMFAGPLEGLCLAEAEFTGDAEMAGFVPASFVVAEVTDDPRFRGGHLVSASRDEISHALADYGLSLASTGQSLR